MSKENMWKFISTHCGNQSTSSTQVASARYNSTLALSSRRISTKRQRCYMTQFAPLTRRMIATTHMPILRPIPSLHICICMCAYACICICMHVGRYVCMPFVYVCMHACMYVCLFVALHAYVDRQAFVHVCIHIPNCSRQDISLSSRCPASFLRVAI